MNSDRVAQLTGSNEWRTHRFELSDAYFGNSQNGANDFRIEKSGGNLFIRRVRVIKESMLSVERRSGRHEHRQRLAASGIARATVRRW